MVAVNIGVTLKKQVPAESKSVFVQNYLCEGVLLEILFLLIFGFKCEVAVMGKLFIIIIFIIVNILSFCYIAAF